MVNTMTIHGKYERDQNFTTIYANNRIYTIAKNTGSWSSVGVGECTFFGRVLTQEYFDELASACSKEGTFELTLN